jgi:hypothetical protein
MYQPPPKPAAKGITGAMVGAFKNVMGTSFDANKSKNDIITFLNKQNIGPPIEETKCKTLLMMDATASMGPLLQKVKDKIKYMFRIV